MTVKELIKELQNYPETHQVIVCEHDDDFSTFERDPQIDSDSDSVYL